MKLGNTLTINLPVGSSNTISIGNQESLKGRTVQAVAARIRKNTGDKASDGEALAEALDSAFLTLKSAKGESLIDALPLSMLDPERNQGQLRELAVPQAIDWSKSFVEYPGRTPADAGKRIPLVVVYQ